MKKIIGLFVVNVFSVLGFAVALLLILANPPTEDGRGDWVMPMVLSITFLPVMVGISIVRAIILSISKATFRKKIAVPIFATFIPPLALIGWHWIAAGICIYMITSLTVHNIKVIQM
jgi:hypothetical protein